MIRIASADYSSRFEAAYALGNSYSRKAVPTLISLLIDQNPEVRRAARDSLATLTHRRSKSDQGHFQEIHDDWASWWASNGSNAPIYGIDDCGEPSLF